MKDDLLNEVGEAYARNTDPGTSHAAAHSVESEATRLEGMVADAVASRGNHGMICDEIVTATGLNWNTVSPRLAPLRRKGVVAPSVDPSTGKPTTRRGKSGRGQIVWFFSARRK